MGWVCQIWGTQLGQGFTVICVVACPPAVRVPPDLLCDTHTHTRYLGHTADSLQPALKPANALAAGAIHRPTRHSARPLPFPSLPSLHYSTNNNNDYRHPLLRQHNLPYTRTRGITILQSPREMHS
jgi:hypothetical protein